METKTRSEEFKVMQAKALEQLRSGQSLTGKGGVFAPLLKEFLETTLAAEMELVKLDEL
jgi:putative transposase